MRALSSTIFTAFTSIVYGAALGTALDAASTVWAASRILPNPPKVSSTSYILMDANTAWVLAERDSSEQLPPASLTKIMTGFVAASEVAENRMTLDDEVPISIKAWRTGGSKMFVREGTKVRLEDLIRGIVIQSGNDASIAVAEYIGGDEDGFANMMNHHARELGMTESHFVNATGLPNDNHYSSVRDLATLTAALIHLYPEHYRLYSERSFRYGDIEQPNRNRLLWRDKSADGVKTGHTDAAGYCLVASALRDGTRLIAVIMGAKSNTVRFQDAQKLLAYGFRYFENQKLYDAGEILATANVWYGTAQTVDAAVRSEIRVTMRRGGYDDLQAVVDMPRELEAPIAAGAQLGMVRVTLDGKTLAEAPLVAQVAVAEAAFFSRLGDSIRLFFRNLLSESADADNAQTIN